jgi:hypothetical protein
VHFAAGLKKWQRMLCQLERKSTRLRVPKVISIFMTALL